MAMTSPETLELVCDLYARCRALAPDFEVYTATVDYRPGVGWRCTVRGVQYADECSLPFFFPSRNTRFAALLQGAHEVLNEVAR